MESRKRQESPKQESRRGRVSRQVLSQKWSSDGRPYTPGQLHLLLELMTEFADHLKGDARKVPGISEWTMTSEMPNLLEFIEFELNRLLNAQDRLETLWSAEAV
ncbi:MAG TPA: hypothetical protein V6D47_12030 [Oscillatoriaceae cyanobacterium]